MINISKKLRLNVQIGVSEQVYYSTPAPVRDCVRSYPPLIMLGHFILRWWSTNGSIRELIRGKGIY